MMCELHPLQTAVMIVCLVSIWLWANVKLAKAFDKKDKRHTYENLEKE